MRKPVVLFILKRRNDFDTEKHNARGLSTGLYNSASFMEQMLIDRGVDARLEIAIDNNCIDRLVTKHRPTHVIIEALWVTPTKFTILSKLHPKVKWIIRLHSEMPFISNEGMAMDWLGDYMAYDNVTIAANAPRMLDDVRTYLQIREGFTNMAVNQKVSYLPNYYPQEYKYKEYSEAKEHIDIGCFGAVRPLKNHLMQAIAALKFANYMDKKLHFHINVGRVEGKGEPVLNNLKALFQQLHDKGHKLIANEWSEREQFLELCGKMDIGLQVSFSETFNIVGADIVSQGVPLVGSIEIPWMNEKYTARAQYCEEIFDALVLTSQNPADNIESNQQKLTEYTNNTADVWVQYFKENV